MNAVASCFTCCRGSSGSAIGCLTQSGGEHRRSANHFIFLEGRINVGLLDGLAGSVLSNMLGGGNSNLIGGVAQMLLGSQSGGLGGLVQAFEKQGLGNIVSSWISTGQNLPVSSDQISQVLGSSTLQQFAQQLGVSHGEASSQLAQFLPTIIDKLTPNGQVPEESGLSQALSFLMQQK
jgi:uncharacterized protein YidB (DUF937 family)